MLSEGMFQVWGKESKCERHTTKRSDDNEKTKESVKTWVRVRIRVRVRARV